jgi:hypothetical protein
MSSLLRNKLIVCLEILIKQIFGKKLFVLNIKLFEELSK